MDISEKNLEDTIEQVLLSSGSPLVPSTPQGVRQPSPLYGPATSNLTPDNVAPGGYRKHTSEEYDKALCLIPEDVLNFIYATQPKEWDKFKKQHEGDARTPFLQRLALVRRPSCKQYSGALFRQAQSHRVSQPLGRPRNQSCFSRERLAFLGRGLRHGSRRYHSPEHPKVIACGVPFRLTE